MTLPPPDRRHWLLDPLTDADRVELDALITVRTVAAGEPIVTEGEVGSEAFVVLRGCADVQTGGPAAPRVLSRLSAGDHFGEQALLTDPPTRRTASVVAIESCSLLVLQPPVVRRLLERHPPSLLHLLEIGTQQAQQVLQDSGRLSQLFDGEEAPHGAAIRSLAAGDLVFEAGDPSDEAYLVVEGTVEILTPGGDCLHLAEPGECFGEMGVLLELPRNACARAHTNVRLLTQDAERFRARISAHDGLSCILQRLWRGYRFDAGYIKQFGARLSQLGQQTTLVRLARGGVAFVTRDERRPGYRAQVVTPEGRSGQIDVVCWGGSAAHPWFRVELATAAGVSRVQSIVATLDRPETGALYQLMVEEEPLTEAMCRQLARTGMVRSPAPMPETLVCRCLSIRRAVVEAAIKDGCHSVAALGAQTGCGTVCGGCRTDLAATLANHLGYAPDGPRRCPVDQRVFSPTPLHALAIQAGPAAARFWGLWNYVRPGLVVSGVVALPVVVVVSLRAAAALGVTLALLFAWDLALARRQWREVFVELLEDGVGIQEKEQREEGFSDDDARGPRNLVMRQLPFGQWIRYKYTLRQDYVLNSAWRWTRHQIRSGCLSLGVERARRWHPNHQPFWGDPARQLGELCLETSLCLGIVSLVEEAGSPVATFRYCDWLCPAGTEVPGEILAVSMLEVRVNLDTRTALACSLNGTPLEPGSDALCFAYLALSGYHHTVLHAYANWAAVPDHPDPHIRQGARWTLATNAVALYTGRACQHDPRSMERVLKYNGRRGMARHGAGPLLGAVAERSRYARFVLQARRVFIETLVEHKLDIDIEALFLMTVVHSLDHHMAGVCVDPHDLVPTGSEHRAAQVIRLLFSEPLVPLTVNTRLSAVQDGWPRDLFARLSQLDADLAGRIDVGISY